MIKSREVAFLKTTGEAVFVMDVGVMNEFGNVKVRRPVQGNSGIAHLIDYFFEEEIESLDEQRKRYIGEREELMKKYGPKVDEQPASENTGFLPN